MQTNDFTPSENNIVIHTRELTKQFGDLVAVDSVDMDIPKGTIFGFIGPSGSGKTTMVRLLTGYYKPTSGEMEVLGASPNGFDKSHREKIGYLNQQFILYPNLTVWENMNFAASIYGVKPFRKKRFNRLLDFVALSDQKKKRANQLSGGMQRRLSLAAALVHDPELLFLDEPTAGIDPILRQKFWDYFKELQNQGQTLFLTTQYVNEAANCDLVGILRKGKLLTIDSPKGLYHRAYGGEIIMLRTAEWITPDQHKVFENLPFTIGPVAVINEHEIEIVADDPDAAISSIIETAKNHQLTPEAIERKSPSFDEIFVKLIEKRTDV